jgi:hypothetical protein
VKGKRLTIAYYTPTLTLPFMPFGYIKGEGKLLSVNAEFEAMVSVVYWMAGLARVPLIGIS